MAHTKKTRPYIYIKVENVEGLSKFLRVVLCSTYERNTRRDSLTEDILRAKSRKHIT